MSSGAKVQLAWIKEVTPGVTPPGDWHTFTRISNGVTPTYNSEANNEIGADRMAQGTAMTTVDVGGDIEQMALRGAGRVHGLLLRQELARERFDHG